MELILILFLSALIWCLLLSWLILTVKKNSNTRSLLRNLMGQKSESKVETYIATETGYFIAFYEKDLDIAENGDGVKPFTGEDGREKVILTDENDNPVIKDLAELVAYNSSIQKDKHHE